ncbi:hypothetical protein F5Y16DRAFT_413490 [Xylariaceae sp. FL0255]|nr:hypothetical protein F5Y16DRAFT_413490 [Xylariaceae sp. FL0255]
MDENNNLTLHGFRRFKTTHLLNLRFLEDEIAELDHIIYQAGLTLDRDPSSPDRLGLQHSIKDKAVPPIGESIIQETILRLRGLLKKYNDALVFSIRPDLSLYEKYNIRLVKTDLGIRTRTDPFQRRLHKHLRAFRSRSAPVRTRWSYQNTIAIADVIGRAIAVAIISVFIIILLALLLYQSRNIQTIVISILLLAFAPLITVLFKVSNLEIMAVTAAYAAVLATFVSTSQGSLA